MGEKENASSGVTDTSSVTAIKVKVILDTTKKELDEQFKPVKERYKNSPIKLAFGVNQNETAKNINKAIDDMIKRGVVKTPKITLDVKIDQSKVTAQLKKAVASAAKQTIKTGSGKSATVKTQDSSKDDIQRLFSLTRRQAKLKADEAALVADGTKAPELATVQKRLKEINNELETLKTKTKNVITESQKLKLGDIEKEGAFNASRNTAKGASSAAKELKKQNDSIKADLDRTLKDQASKYESRRKEIQSLENFARNNSNYKNQDIQNYLYGTDGTTGKLKELREQLSAIQNTDPSKAVEGFDEKCKTLGNTLETTNQHLKELGFDFRDATQANVDQTKFKSVFSRAVDLENSIPDKNKYSELITKINEVKEASANCQGDVTELSADMSKLEIQAGKLGATTETLGQKLSRLFKEHFQTAIAMAGVAMVKQGLREVYNNVLDIDTAVTELRKVSSMTSSEMDDFLDSAASKARELGVSISDYVNSTADWKRLGYTDDDAAELARISGLMKNVGDNIESAGDASSYLISVLQGFHLVADDAEQVLDVANQIANTQPVDMRDLMEGMQRSSSALFAAGNSYSEAMSMVAATNSVLQSPETTGTFLKTLSMYLRAAKTEAADAGLEIDGMANSVSELRSELKQLTGVDIMKDAAGTQFKSTYQIMKELSEVWDKLSDVSQANVTELIAGKRGGQAVSALLTNFDVAEKSMKEAANSAGSAIKENETYLDSINGKVAQLDAAFQQFSKDLLDSSLIKFFVDFATGAVDLADGAVKAAGALPTLTAAISGVLSVMQMSGKLKNGAGKVNMPSYVRCV